MMLARTARTPDQIRHAYCTHYAQEEMEYYRNGCFGGDQQVYQTAYERTEARLDAAIALYRATLNGPDGDEAFFAVVGRYGMDMADTVFSIVEGG